MIAEEKLNIEYHPKISVPTNKIVLLIIKLMKESVPQFKKLHSF